MSEFPTVIATEAHGKCGEGERFARNGAAIALTFGSTWEAWLESIKSESWSTVLRMIVLGRGNVVVTNRKGYGG